MVNEAIKLITGIGEPLIGRLLIFDALEMSWRELKINKDPNTPEITELIDYEAFCGAISDEAAAAIQDSTIDVRTLKEWLDARERGERDFVLVDVREPNEYEIVNIPGSILIPKGEFLTGEAFEKLPKDKQIVLHCKVGGRSAEALAAVKGAGFSDAVHVAGGISAWVSQIEPHKPSY